MLCRTVALSHGSSLWLRVIYIVVVVVVVVNIDVWVLNLTFQIRIFWSRDWVFVYYKAPWLILSPSQGGEKHIIEME